MPASETITATVSNNNTANEENSSRELEAILRWAISTIGAITALALLFFMFFFSKKLIWFAVSNYLVVAAALFVSGCILGFLFGIPKVVKDSVNSSVTSFSDNANLEEISDWLTKIIVGLTLVQFNQIKKMLNEAAEHINVTFRSEGFDFFVLGYAVIIFYIAAGFLISYFWTRTNYTYILAKGKKDIQNLEKKIDLLKKENEEKSQEIQKAEQEKTQLEGEKTVLEEKTEKLKEAVQREGNMRLVNENPLVETSPTDDGINEELKKKIDKLLEERKSTVPDDPQKGRWGGSSSSNQRQIEASVVENPAYNDIYDVNLIIKSTDPKTKPLDKTVVLLLHDSFGNEVLYLKPANNEAKITLLAYEAFTVGAICDDGDTLLELDLNNLPGNPPGFNYSTEPVPVNSTS